MPDSPIPPKPPGKLKRVSEIPLPTAVLGLDIIPSEKRILASCLDGSILEVDESGATPPVELGRHSGYAPRVRLHPDGNTVISSGYDGTLRWHDRAQRKTVRTVQAHEFWSWDAALSRDGNWVASVTGRYEAGGYKYEPAPEREPSVRLYDARTGELRHSWNHVPPVQSVAISPDNRFVAAANLMGEIRIWEVESGKSVHQWVTPDFTSWGIIKSHHYLGGIFDLAFSPDGEKLLGCGMGPMRDPMAGNGRQLWQRFDWKNGTKMDETREGESGQGLMETLTFHPDGTLFVMGGRLFQGTWNLALFDSATGKNIHSIDAKHRITRARFSPDGKRLYLAKAKGQEKKKDGKWPSFGFVEIYDVAS